MIGWFRRIWHDPVWSKVISGVILYALSLILAPVRHFTTRLAVAVWTWLTEPTHVQTTPLQLTGLLLAAAAVIGAAYLVRRALRQFRKRRRMQIDDQIASLAAARSGLPRNAPISAPALLDVAPQMETPPTLPFALTHAHRNLLSLARARHPFTAVKLPELAAATGGHDLPLLRTAAYDLQSVGFAKYANDEVKLTNAGYVFTTERGL
jgi:uncharacterized integral membrane protein